MSNSLTSLNCRSLSWAQCFTDTSEMLVLICVSLVLKLPLLTCSSNTPQCFLRKKHKVSKDGDMVIGGFFPLYTYQNTEDTRGPGQPILSMQ